MLLQAFDVTPQSATPIASQDRFKFYLQADNARHLYTYWHLDSLPEADVPPLMSETHGRSYGEIKKKAIAVTRGNTLTAYLGLHTVHVVTPQLPRLYPATAHDGLPWPLV